MIKFTLHDIFGYLFPGIVTALAIVMLLCACPELTTNVLISELAGKTEPDYSKLIWPMFIMFLLISYILGTLVTSCAQKMKIMRAKKIAQVVPGFMIEKLEKRVDQILGKDWRTRKGDKDDDIFERTCDEYVLQFEKSDYYRAKVGMFFHRMDYCRGSFLAFAVLLTFGFLSFILECVSGGSIKCVVGVLYLLLMAVSAGAMYVFRERFKRFDRLRVLYIAINFLLLQNDRAPKYPEVGESGASSKGQQEEDPNQSSNPDGCKKQ